DSGNVRHVNQEKSRDYLQDSDDKFLFTVNTSSGKHPETQVQIGHTKVNILIDSGASVNLLNYPIFQQIQKDDNRIQLQKTNARIFAYGTPTPLELAGEFQATVTSASGTFKTAKFYVAQKKSKCILGYESSSSLGLIILNINTLNPVQQDHDVRRIINKHPKLFEGTGNLKGREVKLEIDPTVTPVAQTNRKIPHSMKTKVNKKLQEMREEGIIEKVEGATPWLSPLIAIPKKSGDLRLVLDMRIPNTALARRRVQIPTVNEILQKMEGAKVFTEVDLSQGYLQLPLAEESRHITAFSTPEDGPHRFTRLIMGASPSGEHFHEIIHELIKEVPDCANISDNIWLWSKDRETHLKRLDQLLTILRTNGITLKLPKCSFAVPQINVFGHIVSEKGIRPDSTKVEAITNAPHPTTASEVRSFLGLTNYCSRYIPDYSSLTFPLRQLTKKNVTFHWDHSHEKALQSLKNAITTSPVLAHYNLTAETKVVVDASPWALGSVLLQKQADDNYRPIAYGSRSLTDVEQKYGHIEKEGLAIVFGCEHFHMYLYGRSFELETDHRPLEHIYKAKLQSKPTSARLERWRLRLQEYDFHVIYRPGPSNLADPLSRLPKDGKEGSKRSNMEACADRYVHYMTQAQTPNAMKLEDIQRETLADPELQQIKQNLQNNQVYKLPKAYKLIAHELCITDQDILLRGDRIVLPNKLRQQTISLAHEDHTGMVRCKQRLRSKLWWPEMDKQVEERIRCCHPCQLVSKSPRPEPMEPTKLPKKPWSKLAIDVCGPFPTGEQVVVLTDYYSRWPEVKILKSVTSKNILDWLLSVFATHGFPDEIKSDNASYFVSTEFKDTLTSWGIEHKTVTEYWPQANGQVERFNQVLEKHILTAQAEGKAWKPTIPIMLLHYRNTPHRMTGRTPSSLLMNREVKTKLPSFEQQTNDETETRKKDEEEKEKAKKYTDKKRKASPRNLEVGNKVLVTQKHRNKFTTKFHPDPMVITKINGTQIVLKDKNGTQHRRNSSHVKLYQEIPDPEEEIQSDRKHDRQTESREENTEATQTETNQNTTETEIVLRRSTRNRKQPDYLKVG
ncbi:Transposon Tf2-9 poly, partial [Paramuricea clavata]